jgi:hypothetical protein
MNGPADPKAHESALTSREELMTALFANMVIQQTNMALMLLGKVPDPASGQTVEDLDAAQMFIDQLEMLEAKTKGNLDKREEALLKQSLTTVRMAFVETIERGAGKSPAAKPGSPPPTGARQAAPAEPTKISPAETPVSPEGPEARKKFTKKY